MNQIPTTLRSLAGLSEHPPPLADSTVIVIDAQQAYASSGALPLAGLEAATENIQALLHRARELGSPIIHVAHLGATGSPFDPAGGGRFLPGLDPLGDETLVTKTLPNAFAGTELGDHVVNGAGRPLVLVGFMTHMCVSSTARAALDLGLTTTVLHDATATRSLPSLLPGEALAADTVHRAALAGLADRFSIVSATAAMMT